MSSLQRFHQAQGHGPSSIYAAALAELRRGRKQGHWIWFVIPQLQGLGHSSECVEFGLADLEEARLYLADRLLSARLEEIYAVIGAQLQQPGQTLQQLMGTPLDATKTVSSVTLFSVAGSAAASSLQQQLGLSCDRTLALLQR
ncbi:MAG: DUF1810 family protein [Synechococcaceae cyanobacterium]|nr:DUF1810 family protein [Synechococcaceae cyanobacterium]